MKSIFTRKEVTRKQIENLVRELKWRIIYVEPADVDEVFEILDEGFVQYDDIYTCNRVEQRYEIFVRPNDMQLNYLKERGIKVRELWDLF